MESGGRLVERSGDTLAEIVGSMKALAALVGGIARATEEQSVAIEQVNRAVSQMDGMTQQNAALVEQASAASTSVNDQARRLRDARWRAPGPREGSQPPSTSTPGPVGQGRRALEAVRVLAKVEARRARGSDTRRRRAPSRGARIRSTIPCRRWVRRTPKMRSGALLAKPGS